MKRRFGRLVCILVVVSWALAAGATAPQLHVGTRLANLALPFVENAGQADPQVAYYAPTFSGTVFVTRQGEIVYSLVEASPAAELRSVTESFVGGRAVPAAGETAPTQASFFIGNDPSRWHTQVPTFSTVALGNVWSR